METRDGGNYSMCYTAVNCDHAITPAWAEMDDTIWDQVFIIANLTDSNRGSSYSGASRLSVGFRWHPTINAETLVALRFMPVSLALTVNQSAISALMHPTASVSPLARPPAHGLAAAVSNRLDPKLVQDDLDQIAGEGALATTGWYEELGSGAPADA
jgi:hypothetical protein